MQGHRNVLCFHVPGTLSANLSNVWTAAFDGRIKHVSAGGSNSNNGIATLGTTTDPDKFLTVFDIGDSGTPAEKTVANFASTGPLGKFSKGDVLQFVLDFDGDGATATANFTLVITLLEG